MTAVFKFDTRQVPDEPKTLETGVPHYIDEVFVRIKADERSEMTKTVDAFFDGLRTRVEQTPNPAEREKAEEALSRAQRAYERFQNGRPEEIEGVPLQEWPRVNKSMIMTLNHLNIMSVEDMAKASDTQCGKVHGGVRLREEAQRYLEAASEDGASAMATRLTEMERQMAELRKENAELKAMAPEQPKRGRPRKNAA